MNMIEKEVIRLTNQLKNECSTLNFDVNDDGICSLQDGTMIWKYFASTLDINNYKNFEISNMDLFLKVYDLYKLENTTLEPVFNKFPLSVKLNS